MNLKDDLKLSLIKSNNAINDQTYKSLLECSFSELIREQNGPGINTVQTTKPDLIKELHASFLTVIAEFARHDLNKEDIHGILTSNCNFNTNRSNLLCELYDRYKMKLQIILGNIGTHLPHIIDVKWDVGYVVKTSGIDESEGPIFRICLFVEKFNEEKRLNQVEQVNFSCTSQELQDLVYRLKDATRHCQRIAASGN